MKETNGKRTYTLEEFNRFVRRKPDPWPVGAEIRLKNGNVYMVGQVNPLLQATNMVLSEEDIESVRY